MRSAESFGADQRANLYRTKLTSLVRLLFPDRDAPNVIGYADGALAEFADCSVMLINRGKGFQSFGAGLVKCRVDQPIEVWVDVSVAQAELPGIIARSAAALSPVESVQLLNDKELTPAHPAPRWDIGAPISTADPWVQLMQRAGLIIEWSQGAIIGSLRGLEAARIVSNEDGSTRLDVGVGHYDQEAFAMMNAGLDPEAALDEVVRQITELRIKDAPSHPINRLGRTRWLASVIAEEPDVVGLVEAQRVDGLPELGIRSEAPVGLVGVDTAGARVGVVVAVGPDPSMVPAAADLATCAEVDRVVLVVPQRDRYAFLDRMAQMLAVSTSVVSIAVPWSESFT